jgi:hypothetical protein
MVQAVSASFNARGGGARFLMGRALANPSNFPGLQNYSARLHTNLRKFFDLQFVLLCIFSDR